MIQIIGLRKFKDPETGKEKLKHKLFSTHSDLKYIFENINFVLKQIPEEEHWNLYYTALNCKDPNQVQRRLRIFQSQKYIPFDVDGLDVEKKDEYIKLFFELTKLDPAKTAIIFSGNGLQFIVEIPKAFTNLSYFEENREFYKAICSDYDSLLKKNNLPGNMDTVVWSPARLLRLPGTENRKEKKGIKKAYLISGSLAPQSWDWNSIAKIQKVEDDHQIKTWDPKHEPDLDHKEIYSKCDFFKWVKEKPDLVREPHFYAAISIISRMENGEQRVKNLVRQIANTANDTSVTGYSEGELEKKIDQARTASGPRTCKGINSIWGNCRECPNYLKIESPISLKAPDFIATQKTGFYSIIKGRYVPNYDDLLKFFDQSFNFKTQRENGVVWVYENNHYRVFSSTEIANFAYTNFKPRPKKAVVAEFEKLVKSINLVSSDFFTQHINGFLNCQNGILNLRTGEMKPHSPDLGFRYCLDYDYDPEAKCETFQEFMDSIMNGDTERINLLQEFGGYAISGDEYRFHKMLMLTGSGRNGKGTFMHILQKLAGVKNVSSVPLGKMGNENNKQLMEGKLFNFCDEVNKGDFKDIGEIKKMTGEGRILVKLMWHQPYETEARAKIILACNELPWLSETNAAIKNRILLVPFNNEYTEEKGNLDRGIKKKMESELSGILNFFIEGYRRLVDQDYFTRSSAVYGALEDYLKSQNSVLRWLDETEEVVVKPLNGRNTFVKSHDLWKKFNDWNINEGGKEVEHKVFSEKFIQAIDDGKARRQKKQIDGVRNWGFYDIDGVSIPVATVSTVDTEKWIWTTKQKPQHANNSNLAPQV